MISECAAWYRAGLIACPLFSVAFDIGLGSAVIINYFIGLALGFLIHYGIRVTFIACLDFVAAKTAPTIRFIANFGDKLIIGLFWIPLLIVNISVFVILKNYITSLLLSWPTISFAIGFATAYFGINIVQVVVLIFSVWPLYKWQLTTAWYIRNYCTLVSDRAVLDFIEKLVNVEWDDSKSGVGSDARGISDLSMKIHKVYHVNNVKLSTLYDKACAETTTRFRIPLELIERPVATMTVKPAFNTGDKHLLSQGDILHRRSCHLNNMEVFLFHGTNEANIRNLVDCGFCLKFSKRGLYGHPAVYLSELSQKADQYTDPGNYRIYGPLYMFINRAALGNTELFEHKIDGKMYDTVVGGSDKLFREFVKTSENQILPEFLVEYDRVHTNRKV